MRVRVLGLAVLGAAVACSDPVIDVTMEPPSGTFDTSCVASVSLYTLGPTYDQDGTSFTQSCVDLPMSQPTLADIQALIHGTSLALPAGGLAKVVALGNATACAAQPDDGPEEADLIFYAQADYAGDGAIDMPMVPNVACATSSVTVTSVDLIELASTHSCAQSLEPDDPMVAGINVGAFTVSQFGPGAFFSGGIAAGYLGSGAVATVNNAHTTVESGACLAFWAGDNNWVSLACAQTTPTVCAGQTDEVGVIQLGTSTPSANQSLQAQFGPPTYGIVYSGAGETGAPVANATVTLDDGSAGTVVYYDLNPAAVAGAGALTPRTQADGGAATGSAGLFIVYAQGLQTLTVRGNGVTQKVRVAAESGYPGTVIVRLE